MTTGGEKQILLTGHQKSAQYLSIDKWRVSPSFQQQYMELVGIFATSSTYALS